MTNDTSGPMSPKQFAEFDRDSSCWRTWPGIGLWGSVTYSQTWPRCGTWDLGSASELPTSAPATDESESSFLLGTPRASDGITHPLRTGVVDPRGRLEDQISMLPTPTARDHKGHNQRRDDTCLTGALLPTPRAHDARASMQAPAARQHVADGSGSLAEVLGIHLLPPPTASRYGSNQSPSPGAAVRPSLDTIGGDPALACCGHRRSEHDATGCHGRLWNGCGCSCRVAVVMGELRPARLVDWGKYEPGIRRHERILGRLAPYPSEPAPKGGRRLAPRFVEWMQMLDEGWVTDVPDVSRDDQLTILGNGVVVQQAVEATRRMLLRSFAAVA